jgi:type I restriction enzyme S subunit
MEWPRVPLDQIAVDMQPGFACQPTSREDGVPQLRTNNVSSEGRIDLTEVKRVPATAAQIEKYALRQGDILFNNTNSPTLVGKTAFFDEGGLYLFSNHMTRIRVNTETADPRFVARYLHWAWEQGAFRGLVTQWVNQAAINRSQLGGVLIPLPPLSEQRRIVEILDQADRLRRLRAEADAKADRILPALFIQMFGDPSTNPMGWPICRLGDALGPVSRRNPGETPDEPFVYIDIAGVDGGSGEIVETKTLLGAEAPSRARQVIKAGDVLVSTVRPYLRATALVPAQLDGHICSTGFCVLRPRDKVLRGYLYALTRTQWFTEQLMNRSRGASYPAVTDRDIWDLPVPSPSDAKVLEDFNALLDALLDQRRMRRSALTTIANLFTSLLSRPFAGSLTASWREAHMKELLQEMEQQAKALATG